MKRKKISKTVAKACLLTVLTSVFFVLALSPAICSAASFAGSSAGKYNSLDELAGKRVGVQVGTVFDDFAREAIPDVQVDYFSTFPDEINALKASKIDAVVSSEFSFDQLRTQDDSIRLIDDPIGSMGCCFVYPKNEHGKELCMQMNEFLKGLRESDELDRLEEIWMGSDESLKTVDDYTKFPATNGSLVFVTEGTFPPYDYFRDGQLVGYDVDIAIRFCKEYGYALEMKDMNFDALMPAIQSGKCDFGGSGIVSTPERAKKAYFSDPDNFVDVRVAVLSESSGGGSLISRIRDSFNKTFVVENRYQLFLKGILNTLTITVLSIICGTIIGFLLYMWCRNGGRTANGVTRFCVWLVQGMPGIVLLMLLYYVVFGKTSIGGIWVAVIGFSMTFGASVYSMILSGVKAVDYGQTEASYALGFNDRQAFFGIILPQAAQHFMPAYKAEIVTLIKATAVVGYIAVQDLTKMGDIIRSRTYEAFFPLISVAVIYFILAAILTRITDRLTISVDPKKRSDDKVLREVGVK